MEKEMIEITEKAVRSDKEVGMADLLKQELAELQKAMIEEMAKESGGCDYLGRPCEKCWCKEECECSAYAYAEAYFNAGYPKIPESSIVLTEMQYNALLSKQSTVISVDEQLKKEFEYELKQTRKETAEKYFNAVIEMLKEVKQFETIDIKDLVFLHEKNKEYAKQFGVGVEE